MLIPPIAILAGFMLLCYKRRKTYAASEEQVAETLSR